MQQRGVHCGEDSDRDDEGACYMQLYRHTFVWVHQSNLTCRCCRDLADISFRNVSPRAENNILVMTG
jgi:hypothetical protein